MAHTVFICHSSQDKLVANAACAALEAQRIPCWIAPRDILAGEEYGEAIVDALSGCQIVLLIFSLNANNSPQVRREIERAVSKEKIIVPFRIEDVQPSRAMEFALSNTHWMDAISPPMEHRLTELCATISRLMQRREPTDGTHRVTDSVVGVPPHSRTGSADGIASTRKSIWSSRLSMVLAVVIAASVVAVFVALLKHWPSRYLLQLARNDAKVVNNHPVYSPKATYLLQKACDFGEMDACTELAIAYVQQNGDGSYGLQQDYQKALVLFQRACDAGSPYACYSTGYLSLVGGNGVPRDAQKALAIYQKVCDSGYENSCDRLGLLYEGQETVKDGVQQQSGVQQNLAKARQIFQRSCGRGDDEWACIQLTYRPFK
jgi:TIR domain-containing protein/Sel1 repeat-containing protein